MVHQQNKLKVVNQIILANGVERHLLDQFSHYNYILHRSDLNCDHSSFKPQNQEEWLYKIIDT